ncbi:hypothetical protein PVA45_06840 [Entomospira entomophila]|uniref:Uncharacterized protein n=1 Tax=Entomospira entomophila TaxID=2719988 RepID=A0A968G9X0_9SPIO|nr:hypothetical protein [Entomospira entomophilus]NIZ41217.1 hypothetical protein [Entomospira entomophilus]WDI35423.1 hypothetical protein PVA45_06840 [Entomospira entomophilus]
MKKVMRNVLAMFVFMMVSAPSLWAVSNLDVNMILKFDDAVKRNQKLPAQTALMTKVTQMRDAMKQISTFKDYKAPVVTPKEDWLAMILQNFMNAADFAKIDKRAMLKDGSIQRDWLKALVTVRLELDNKKSLTSKSEYQQMRSSLVKMWGSEQFVTQKMAQIKDFAIEGILLATLDDNTNTAAIDAARKKTVTEWS